MNYLNRRQSLARDNPMSNVQLFQTNIPVWRCEKKTWMWKIIFPKTTSKNAGVQKVSEFENLLCLLSPPEALNLVLLSNQCNNISLSPRWHRRLLDYSIVQIWRHFDSNPCLEKCPKARRHSDQVKALSMLQFSKAWSSVHSLYVFMFPHFSLGKLFFTGEAVPFPLFIRRFSSQLSCSSN